jgi:isoleucyl-tRNA synthetase
MPETFLQEVSDRVPIRGAHFDGGRFVETIWGVGRLHAAPAHGSEPEYITHGAARKVNPARRDSNGQSVSAEIAIRLPEERNLISAILLSSKGSLSGW